MQEGDMNSLFFSRLYKIPGKIFSKIVMIRKYAGYAGKKTLLPFYPDRLYVEATNRCNLSCPMCPTGIKLMKRSPGIMDPALFRKIMDEIGPHVKTVVMHIWGEPLLDPNIFDKISYAKNFPVTTELSTNVTLLSAKKASRLLASGLDVLYLCVDGARKETYENLRRGAYFEKTTENIERLLRMKKEKGLKKPFVNLQIVDMDLTRDQVDEFERTWLDRGADAVNIKPLDTWGGQIQQINNLESNKRSIPVKRYHCPNLWYHAHIYWDGTLVCCDRDFNAEFNLGNVKNGVMKVWNGARMQELRRKHIDGLLEDVASCSKCVEWSWWKPGYFSSWGNIPEKK
jgi:radical SAM protein with 4Fe4S-binding SPASM domain